MELRTYNFKLSGLLVLNEAILKTVPYNLYAFMISVLRIAERKEKKPLATINNCPNRQLPSLMINRMKLILAEGDPPSTSRRLTFRSRYSVFWFSALFCPQEKSIAMFLTSWPSLLPNLHLLNKPKGCEKIRALILLKEWSKKCAFIYSCRYYSERWQRYCRPTKSNFSHKHISFHLRISLLIKVRGVSITTASTREW